jgi:tRNA-specific 2-thiouridylase
MSGGIDSAVAALLLKDQGHNVVGVFMKNWDPSDECGTEQCDIDTDYKDMQEVCSRLEIPSYQVSHRIRGNNCCTQKLSWDDFIRQVNFVKEYWNEVFSPFLDAYQAGKETPNPDAFCNRHVKFKHLLSYVNNKLGIDMIATGHYSRTVHNGDHSTRLLKGTDPTKDQSYFLALTKVRIK